MMEVTLPARWRWKAERKATAIESERLFDGPFLYDHRPPSHPPQPAYTIPSAPQHLQIPNPSRSSSVISTAPPLRRSTRKIGLVKNPYIVKEAITLRAARNRVFALIDASEEARRVAERERLGMTSEALDEIEPSLASLHVQRLLGRGGSLRSRSSTPIRSAVAASAATKGKKRRRHELEVDQTSERYEAAYGYGEKDSESMDMERELEAEYQEIVTRLWIEGPATTGAVVSYMKARKRLLRVVALVEEWEAYKAQHGIKDSAVAAHSTLQQLKSVPPLAKTSPAVSREGTPVGRRNLRPRIAVTRAPSQVESEPPAKRQRRQSPAVTPTKAIGASSSSLSVTHKTRMAVARQSSTFTELTSASSESHEDPFPHPPASSLSPPPVSAAAAASAPATEEVESPTKNVVVRKRGRPAKKTTTDNSPTGSITPLPSPFVEGRILRRASTRAASASKSCEREVSTEDPEARSLRPRRHVSRPTRFNDSTATAAILTS
ncbi:hypothetical protein FRB97_009206 [Tulasnella sp. 331]|nr:hypothetical protein FRB97_009206 [Tulasnella sp. 331]